MLQEKFLHKIVAAKVMIFCEKSKHKKFAHYDLPILNKKVNFAATNAYTAHGQL